jgi:transposase-like protein
VPHIRRRDSDREQFWRQTILQQRSSGQSIAQFCRSGGLSPASFYAWRRTLAEREPSPASTVPMFAPLRVVPDLGIEVVLPTGVIVRVPAGADLAAAAKLVAALGSPSC